PDLVDHYSTFSILSLFAACRIILAAFGNNFPKGYVYVAVNLDEAIEGCSESNVCTTAGAVRSNRHPPEETEMFNLLFKRWAVVWF
ncbi:hypothetical protein ACE1BH_05230, partial [Aeromonas jandaei]